MRKDMRRAATRLTIGPKSPTMACFYRMHSIPSASWRIQLTLTNTTQTGGGSAGRRFCKGPPCLSPHLIFVYPGRCMSSKKRPTDITNSSAAHIHGTILMTLSRSKVCATLPLRDLPRSANAPLGFPSSSSLSIGMTRNVASVRNV